MQNKGPKISLYLKRLVSFFLITAFSSVSYAEKILWPISGSTFSPETKIENYIFPNIMGNIEAGTFGYTKNNQTQLNKGIDIKSTKLGKRKESLDEIISVLPGRVVHINKTSENSYYGRYVVIQHSRYEPAIFTLYAHLKNPSLNIKLGSQVKAGTLIGIMGRSAGGYIISKDRVHLHFEMGLMLNENFPSWYDKQEFDYSNKQGKWNMMNLVTFDPLQFYAEANENQYMTFNSFFKCLTPALTINVYKNKLPNFIVRYPVLSTQPLDQCRNIQGWTINFTEYGFPFNWTPFYADNNSNGVIEDDIVIVNYLPESFTRKGSYKILKVNKDNSSAELGSELIRILDILFY